MVSAEQIVLAPQGQRSNGILHKVVVYAEAAVVHITSQSRHQWQCVSDCLADAALLRRLTGCLIHPLLEQEDNRICLLLSFLFHGISGDAVILGFVFYMIEPVDVSQSLAGSVFIFI